MSTWTTLRSRVYQSRSFFLWGLAIVSIAVFLLACALPKYAVKGQLAARESRARAILQSYQSHGLFAPQSLANTPQFVVSKGTFTYKAFDNADFDKAISAFNATDPQILQVTFMQFATYIGNAFAQNTAFANKVQVNALPKDDFINIYFLDADPDGLTNNFDNNCEYIGIFNSIICSAQFIAAQFAQIDGYQQFYDTVLTDRFTHRRLQPTGENRELIVTAVKESFLMWVLGHEIGHAVLHKQLVLSGGPLHFDLTYSPTEKQADEFVARSILNDFPQAVNFWIATGEYIQHEYRSQAVSKNSALIHSNTDNPDFVLNTKITVNYTRYHVPLLLRALHVEALLLGLAPQIDSTGFYDAVEKNVSIENDTPERIPAVRMAIILSALIGGCLVIAINRRGQNGF